MLVLSRRPGEEIILDGDIRVTVLSVKGDRVRLGIAAPPSVKVMRQEVLERQGEEVALPGACPGLKALG